jgi:hypothetical protein
MATTRDTKKGPRCVAQNGNGAGKDFEDKRANDETVFRRLGLRHVTAWYIYLTLVTISSI